MSFVAEQAAIESRFAAQWGDLTPVEYENVPFTPPNDTPWVRLTVIPGTGFMASMGDTKVYRNPGVIDVGIFAPIGSALKDSANLADVAAAVFRGQQFSGITCRAPSFFHPGVVGGWYQTTMSVPYHRDEIL